LPFLLLDSKVTNTADKHFNFSNLYLRIILPIQGIVLATFMATHGLALQSPLQIMGWHLS